MNLNISFIFGIFILLILCSHLIRGMNKSFYLNLGVIGVLLILYTTLSFSKLKEIRNIYFIPILAVFIPLIGIQYVQNNINQYLENYGLEDELDTDNNSKLYRGVIGLYIAMVVVFFMYLASLNKDNTSINIVLTFSILLFIFLEVIIIVLWFYYNRMIKQRSDG